MTVPNPVHGPIVSAGVYEPRHLWFAPADAEMHGKRTMSGKRGRKGAAYVPEDGEKSNQPPQQLGI